MTTTHPGERAGGGAPRAGETGGAARLAAAGGLLGAFAAASCCVVPLVLFSVGATGAWIGNLTMLAPYQPYVIAVTLVMLSAGFVMVYRAPKPAGSADDASCAQPTVGRLTKPALWAATALVAAAAAFPYVAPALLDL